MGWNESPAYFYAATEMMHNVAQAWIDQDKELPKHIMEPFTVPTGQPRPDIKRLIEERYKMANLPVPELRKPGTSRYWRQKQQEVYAWINHHVHLLTLIHIGRCRRIEKTHANWSPQS